MGFISLGFRHWERKEINPSQGGKRQFQVMVHHIQRQASKILSGEELFFYPASIKGVQTTRPHKSLDSTEGLNSREVNPPSDSVWCRMANTLISASGSTACSTTANHETALNEGSRDFLEVCDCMTLL